MADGAKLVRNENGEWVTDESEVEKKSKQWKEEDEPQRVPAGYETPYRAPVWGDPAKAGEALQESVERLMSVANKVREGADPAGFAEELKAISVLIASVLEKYPYPKPKAKREEEAPAEDVAEIALVDDVENLLILTEKVAKGGARMSKDRYNRLAQAVKLLNDIFSEVSPPASVEAEEKNEKQETKKAEEPEPTVANRGVKKLAAVVGQLTDVVKRQQEQLIRLEKSRAASNALPVEGVVPLPKKVIWPMDMAATDDVMKGISFDD